MSIKYNGQTIAGNYTSQIIGLSNTEKAGIIKIATDEEINTGTSNQVATTPLHLSKKQDKLIAGENVTLTPNKGGTTIDVNVPPNVLVDNTTIVKNEADVISAIAVRTKNNEILYDWIGTSEEYESGISDGSISLDWLCYITDDEFVFDSNEIVDNARDTVLNDIGIRTYSINNVYKEKELVITVNENNELKLYRSLVDDNTGHELTDTNYWAEENIGSGGGLEIGDIGITVFAIDETQGLRRYLNGQQIPINDNTQAFLEKLEATALLYPSILTSTQQEWDDIKSSSAFGQCGKFYIDPDKTYIQLPCITGFIQGLSDLSALGDMVEAGLPNITGTMNNDISEGNSSGCISITSAFNGAMWQGAVSVTRMRNWNIDASRSSSIYGNSTTVQPESIKYPYFIQIATGQKTEVNITNTLELNNPYTLFDSKYSETELYNISWLKSDSQWNSKSVYTTAYEALTVEQNTQIEKGISVDLPSGASYTKRGLSVKLSTEEYTDYDFVINTTDETFRLPIKTNLASGRAVVGNGMGLGLRSNTVEATLAAESIYNNDGVLRPIQPAGQYITGTPTSGSSLPATQSYIVGVVEDPTKSGLELSDSNLYLYYYVGETVQNANLINVPELQITKLNVDCSNATPTTKETITTWGIPDYTAATTLVLPNVGEIYTVPYDCLIYVAEVAGAASNVISLHLNSLSGPNILVCGAYSSASAFLKKGTKIYVGSWATGYTQNIFPLIGVES